MKNKKLLSYASAGGKKALEEFPCKDMIFIRCNVLLTNKAGSCQPKTPDPRAWSIFADTQLIRYTKTLHIFMSKFLCIFREGIPRTFSASGPCIGYKKFIFI